MAKVAFLGLLPLPDSAYSHPSGVAPLPYGLQEELEETRRTVQAADRLGLINREAVLALEDKGLPVEQWIDIEREKLLTQEESDRNA